jgi:pimeloyl-ACP methyl ester carboxylesterase
MSRRINVSLVILLVLTFLPAAPVQAQSNADCDYFGTHSDGALYCISMPTTWNGDLVIFAHGYVAVDEPVDIPWSQMRFVNEYGYPVYLPDVINSLGFAFATTSYSVNGLAVKQGIDDIVDLIGVFNQKIGAPNHVYLVGASEGGLVTTLVIERYPDLFSGGLAACGPIGSFTGQVNYWGDFRVIFDYFMDTPDFDVLPGNAMNIPASLINKWDSVYIPRISNVLGVNPLNTQQLFSVTRAPFELSDLSTIGQTTLGILWYNVFATNDAVEKLGGRPYDNFDRVYTGSFNDALLNAEVKRFKPQPAALEEIANYYETTGNLMRPLVTMHTTGDPIVPAWHQELYTEKVPGVFPAFPYVPITINRYGHCSFTLAEIQAGFSQLVGMVMYSGMSTVAPMRALEAGGSSQQGEGTYSYDYR